MNSLKLYPFMPQRKLTTDEEVNSATASGMYHVTGDNGISVVLNYSIMIVFNDGQGYVIQMAFRLGADVAGFRRYWNGEWEILELLYWLLRNMDYLCTAHGVVHIRIGWHRLVPGHPFFNPMSTKKVCQLPQV